MNKKIFLKYNTFSSLFFCKKSNINISDIEKSQIVFFLVLTIIDLKIKSSFILKIGIVLKFYHLNF